MIPVFKQVEFVKSITDLHQKPEPKLPEVAFAGRSNVGKSTMLNSILNRRKLVKTSSTPGKTQLINYFMVDDRYYFVDLPGYGYARLPRAVSAKWQQMLEKYITGSAELKLVCLLLDVRHSLQKTDAQMSDWLNYRNIPYLVLLTKADKLGTNKLNQQIKYFKSEFPDHHVLPFSSQIAKYKEAFAVTLKDLLG